MRSGIIGHTGFIGANIRKQLNLQSCYNSKNIEEIQGKEFDILYCAGTPGTKWYANKYPNRVRSSIEALVKNLHTATFAKLVLISTIGIYEDAQAADENEPIKINNLPPYGRHRHLLEQHVQESFDSLIVRLPSLFGSGLKKNFIYDAIRDDYDYAPHPSSSMQFYNVGNLSKDIKIALDAKIASLNISSEPIRLSRVYSGAFGLSALPASSTSVVQYDMRTKHSEIWGNRKNYIYSEEEIIQDLKKFVETEKKNRRDTT